jgi:hypothetical protein
MSNRLRSLLRNWGLLIVGPRGLVALFKIPGFCVDYFSYRRLEHRRSLHLYDSYPCLFDITAKTPFDPHYFYQGAWLARRLFEMRPSTHVDVGSSVLMISVVSAIVPTLFVDYRPLQVNLPGLTSIPGDITRLPFDDGSVTSLSCFHVIEHIGLGRYGDALNALGSENALRELSRVSAPGARLYLSVPVGRERVCFNAHRVFEPNTILNILDSFKLMNFALIDDNGNFLDHAMLEQANKLEYGCGMFELVKKI